MDVGAEVDAVDRSGATPLHIAARQCVTSQKTAEKRGAVDAAEVLRVLVHHGAHLDARCVQRKAPVDILKGGGLGAMGAEVFGATVAGVTLKCLAARRVAEAGVVYKGRVPRELEAFVRLH